jgi:hypothetical protein
MRRKKMRHFTWRARLRFLAAMALARKTLAMRIWKEHC